ncbi:hypothetical protein D3C74_470730 [compost metagenome]
MKMVQPLDPKVIPKFVNQLVIPPVFTHTVYRQPTTGQEIGHAYQIDAVAFLLTSQEKMPHRFSWCGV